jgi:acyl transferase domain-containing protein
LHHTSNKANLGHAEAASGFAGLAKLVLMLRHGRVPPQVSLKTLNPRIRKLGGPNRSATGGEAEGEDGGDGGDGAVIDREAADWPRVEEGRPRLAMLNNFGAGGSNAAVLVAEYIADADGNGNTKARENETLLCGLSAKSERALAALREELALRLESFAKREVAPSLVDVCATLTSRRQVYDWRVAVTASSLGELAEKMRAAALQRVTRGGPWARAEAAFVFSGQGSQVCNTVLCL